MQALHFREGHLVESACPSPILDRTPFSLNFIMLVVVYDGDGGRQLKQSQLPNRLPAAVLVVYPVRLIDR